MMTTVAVGTYNIRKEKEVEHHFSKMRQDLLDDGWKMRGDMHSHVHIEQYGHQTQVYVTLIQDFEKEKS